MNLLQAGRIIGLVVPAVALALTAPGVLAHHHDHHADDASPDPVVTCDTHNGAFFYVATPEVYELSNQ